jgi:hypothetical protein
MDEQTSHPDAPENKAGKYARVERERRFLMRTTPVGKPIRRVLIEDRYLRGTRLRLRRMTDLASTGSTVVYKFTQKIPAPAGLPGLITTFYLSEAEYETLTRLPADRLRKVRESFPPLGVDSFEGPLQGLILAEAEFDGEDDAAHFEATPEAIAEVTADLRFTGGQLVTMTADQVADLLAAFGL